MLLRWRKTRYTHIIDSWVGCRDVPSCNIGDRMVWLGARSRLMPGRHRCLFYFIPEDRVEPILKKTDVLVLTGTPWLWGDCERSHKFLWVDRVLRRFHGPKLALGIGSCYPLDWDLDRILNSGTGWPLVKDFLNQFDLIKVRDQLASDLLTALEIPHELEPCPSWQAARTLRVKSQSEDYDVAVLYDPAAGISAGTLGADFFRRWDKYWVKRSQGSTRVLSIHPADTSYAQRLGLRAEPVASCRRLLEILSRCRRVYSGRVHAAIPALSMGKDAYVAAVDSRASTAFALGAKPIEI